MNIQNGEYGNDQQEGSADPFDFQEVMKDMPEFGQGIARDDSEVYNDAGQRIDITSESVKHYIDDRRQENYDRIGRRGKPFLADVYKNLMQEYPELRNVLVVDKDIKSNAYYSCATTSSNGQILPTMNFNFSNTETYLKPENIQEGDNFGLDNVLKTIALKTGAKPSEIMRNERLVTAFIMLHEFGHALDFQRNYLGVELSKIDGSGKGVRALPKAISRDLEDRLRDEMTKPIPGQFSTDGYLEMVVPFARRLRAFGIDPHDPNDVNDSRKRSYREMSSEAYADNFATEYVMRHYDDFFEDADSDVKSSEKVKTHVGEMMRINANLGMLGLREGRAVRMTKVELEGDGKGGLKRILAGDPPRVNEGFLQRKIKVGEGIRLLKEGDPTSMEKYAKSPAVKNVYIRPRKDAEGRVVNDIIMQLGGEKKDGDGQAESRFYLVELMGKEPEEIDVAPEEMLKRYKLGVGSKIMLMKRELESDSDVRLGRIMGGRLEKPDYFYGDSPIQEGHGIHLSSSAGERTGVGNLVDPEFMNGGNTSTIDRVYRKWKSYFVETATSTYEVIPYA